MRNFIMIAVVAITIPFLDICSASAEGLNGEQIKKLLIGNTFYRQHENRRGRSRETWMYFKNKTTRGFKQIREGKRGFKTEEYEMPWKVTADGKICWQIRREGIGSESCRNNVRVKGDVVKMDGVDGVGNRKFKILKGNPEGL